MASTDIATQYGSIKGLGRHRVMAETNQDETARLNYHMALHKHLREEVQSGNKTVYETRVEPAFVRANGRKPKDRHEVRKAMRRDPYYQWWACMRRHIQEHGSQMKAPMIERQIDDLVEKARVPDPEFGSLRLDEALEAPRYQTALDMHWFAGSFGAEYGEGDVFQAATYDLGGLYLSLGGKMGPFNDGPGRSVTHWLAEKHPEFKPRRVLDVGCTVGHSTVAYADVWPDAEVYGIDFAANLLRYGHARAEDLGAAVHYSQQRAEETDFDEGSFDLVVSSMFLHETSYKAVYKIVDENRRLLAPGGLMLHVEQPTFDMLPTPYAQFENDWDTHNNNEPFWGTMHNMDLEDVALKAGFKRQDIFREMAPFVMPQADGRMLVADKGAWFFFGAWN
jgi:ubiquinone/menaquinone biosynthesis C-methylase UbiE